MMDAQIKAMDRIVYAVIPVQLVLSIALLIYGLLTK